jgi:hypothetical protein
MMNLKRIKCLIVGHDWAIIPVRTVAGVVTSRICTYCGHEHVVVMRVPKVWCAGANINPAPTYPRPPAPASPPPPSTRSMCGMPGASVRDTSSDTWDVIEQCIKDGVTNGKLSVNAARAALAEIKAGRS